MNVPVYLSGAEVARRLGLSGRSAAYNAFHRGTLKAAAFVDNTPVFSRGEVWRYKQRHLAKPPGQAKRPGRPRRCEAAATPSVVCPLCRWVTKRANKPGRGFGSCNHCGTPLTTFATEAAQ